MSLSSGELPCSQDPDRGGGSSAPDSDWRLRLPALAALGAVLCLGPGRSVAAGARPGPAAPWPLQPWLQGLTASTTARHEVEIDGHGPSEVLWLDDARGQCRFALGLLPDTDLLAWDRMLEVWPARRAKACAGFACSRRAGLALARWREGGWLARPGRLVMAADGSALGLAPKPGLSAAGWACAGALSARCGARLQMDQ